MTLPPAIRHSDDVVDRRASAHDLWPRRLLELREGMPVVLPARVLWPEHEDDVVAIVKAARVQRTALVAFGAGSGVCGGISPTSQAWIIDMKRMSRLLSVDAQTGVCVVQAGIIGERLESQLNARGLTLGHFPSSIYCSTVGGWAATRSAGQLSSSYGKIEDMVLAIDAVDGVGRRLRASVSGAQTGPGALQLLLGSEGALCIITRVTLRVRPMPSHRWLRGYRFASLDAGVNAMRTIMQGGEAPCVMRLYDGVDAALSSSKDGAADADHVFAGAISRANNEVSGPGHVDSAEEPTLFDKLSARVDELALFSRPTAARRIVGEILGRPQLANAVLERLVERPRFIIGVEGDADVVGARIAPLKARLAALGGQDVGTAPGERWLTHRHRVSYRMSRAIAAGSWVDTFEVAVGWQGVTALHAEMRSALIDVAVVMCHMSHAYVDGCSLYFTFAGGGGAGQGPRCALSRYDQCWQRALAVAHKHRAVVAHHHGVGRSKLAGLRTTQGQRALLTALKAELDPDGILNPGVLGLGASS